MKNNITKNSIFSSVFLICISIFTFSQTPQTVKFHDTKGNIEVTKSGQLQFTVPIDVPPGVKALSPKIDIVYSSGSNNGLVGYGGNIAGITSISRVGRTIEKDTIQKGVQLDYTDLYSFNGQRLILKSGEYGKDGAEYVTEKYSNIRIKSFGSITAGAAPGFSQPWQGPEYWEVTFEDGSRAWYGATTSGYSMARTPIDYYIVKSKDIDGNYMSYNYEMMGNTSVVNNIQWGGNEVLNKPHFNKMSFEYDLAPNSESAYIKGQLLQQSKILKSIVTSSNSNQYRKYVISYKKDLQETDYRYIEKIQVSNSNNEAAEPISFTYERSMEFQQNPAANTWYWSSAYPPDNEYDISGDFDGDGKLDVVRYFPTTMPGIPQAGLYLLKNALYVAPGIVFLGNSVSRDQLKNSTAVNYKKNNLIYNKQGFVTYKKVNNPSTSKKDLELSFYSISENNNLVLDYTKVIPNIEKYNLFDDPDELDPPGNSSMSILGLNSIDFNGDGLNELILQLKYRFCSSGSSDPGVSNENFLPGGGCTDYYKYVAIDPDENTTGNQWYYALNFGDNNFSKYKGGDFNGDGLMDFLRVDNQKKAYLITFQKNGDGKYDPVISSFPASGSADMSLMGLWDQCVVGDYNGDGLNDLFIPKAADSDLWYFYTSTGNGFIQDIQPFVKPLSSRSVTKNSNDDIYVLNPRQVLAYDINNDGKTELVCLFSGMNYIKSALQDNNQSVRYDHVFGAGMLPKSKFKGGKNPYNAYFNGPIYLNSGNIDQQLAPGPTDYVGIPLNYQAASMMKIAYLVSLANGNDPSYKRNTLSHPYYDIAKEGRVVGITQGNVTTNITYKELDKNINPDLYNSTKVENYPYLEFTRASKLFVISQLTQTIGTDKILKQDFRYRGLVSNILGKGMIGFRQTARSSWYADGFENTKIWSGVEIDPLNEGLPIKEWSIRTNTEASIFPTNISENNTQLLSFKSSIYQIDKLLNGQPATTVANADKAKVVTAIFPKTVRAKDFLTNVVAENTTTYGAYYLPTENISKINTSYSVKTTNYTYANNPSGLGADYYIGRLISKTDHVSAYGDTKNSKEDYTYENNRIKTIKKWNLNNTGYTIDTFTYGDFGNITQKVSGSSIDSKTVTSGFEYEPKGRFITRQIDNLGLSMQTGYNDWGQVLSQTDHFGNTITSTYDNWGKLISSTNSLTGTTAYAYEKDNSYNVKITSSEPDGNISETYTNKLGQVYKTSTKAFANTKFVFTEIQYDILGRKTKESEPYYDGQSASQWNITEYNDAFYPAKVTGTLFNGKKVETSVSGLTTTVKEINGNLRTTTSTTDALGNVISTTDKGGMIQFSYNAAGQQIEAKYAENIVSTAYDQWGRKSQFNDPSNGVYMYEYDGLGRTTKTVSPKGYKEYTYNNFGQLISQFEFSEVDGGQTTNKKIAFSYNPKGQIISKEGIAGAQSFSSVFTYDPHGRLLSSIENSFGRTFSQKNIIYDDKGRISSYRKELKSSGIITGVDIESSYSEWNGELYQIKDKNKNQVLWELKDTNAKGQVKIASLGSSDIVNNYNASGFLNSIDHSSSIEPDILKISYSFDPLKNELQNRTTSGALSIIETFDYDDNNRLVNWTNPVTGIKPSTNRNKYDIKGRILENDQVGTMKYENTSAVYRATGMTLNTEGDENYDGDLIQTIIYNENNDPVFIDGEKGDVGFQYGLTSMRQKVTYKGNFGNDGEGELTKFYNEDGSFEVVRDNKHGEEKHIIYIGGSPYESNIIYLSNTKDGSGAYRFLHKDYLGSILAITDEDGKRIEQRHFDAWGNLTHLKIGSSPVITDKAVIANTALLVDRGFTGHEYFSDVAIMHMNGRLYDPLLRRFLNADENIQDPSNTQNYNKYGYVMNNPMIYSDPSGEVWWWAVGALAGSYISGVQANGGQLNPVKWDWQNTWSAVLGGAIGGASIGGALGNIVNNAGAIKNVLPGIVSGGLNSAFTGSNFLGGMVGGISYTGNVFDNITTSTDGINAGYKYIVTPEENYAGGDWEDLTKKILLDYVKTNFCETCSMGRLQQMAGIKFEQAFNTIMGIDYKSLKYESNDEKIEGMYKKKIRNTKPDGIFDLIYDEYYTVGKIQTPIPKKSTRFSGVQFAEVKAMDGTLYSGSNQGQIASMLYAMSKNSGVNKYGGQFIIGTTSDTKISPNIIAEGIFYNIQILHITAQYRMISGSMQMRLYNGGPSPSSAFIK